MPLRLFEQRVLAGVDSEAPARLLYERSVGAVDAVVGSMLARRRRREAWHCAVERSEALGEAARLDELATQNREQADDELRRKRERAAAAPGEARQKTDHKVNEARSAAEKRKRQATQTAAKRTAEAKQRMDEGAANKLMALKPQNAPNSRESHAAEQSATAAAEADLDDAADKRSEAVDKRGTRRSHRGIGRGREGGAEGGARRQRQGVAREVGSSPGPRQQLPRTLPLRGVIR